MQFLDRLDDVIPGDAEPRSQVHNRAPVNLEIL